MLTYGSCPTARITIKFVSTFCEPARAGTKTTCRHALTSADVYVCRSDIFNQFKTRPSEHFIHIRLLHLDINKQPFCLSPVYLPCFVHETWLSAAEPRNQWTIDYCFGLLPVWHTKLCNCTWLKLLARLAPFLRFQTRCTSLNWSWCSSWSPALLDSMRTVHLNS